jgi:cytidylate kinase
MMIIAIDGPAATGKSTTAKAVADQLGFAYIDTGAMYRAVTWAIVNENINVEDEEMLKSFMASLGISMSHLNQRLIVEVNGMDVSQKIREPKVTGLVSEISAIPVVREALVQLQRKLATGKNCIVEGRDIGTVVFPKADLKFYMIADDKIRAKRRNNELEAMGRKKDLNELEREIKNRDSKDSSRTHSPLTQPEGAIIIDTSYLNFNEQVNQIIETINKIKRELK